MAGTQVASNALRAPEEDVRQSGQRTQPPTVAKSVGFAWVSRKTAILPRSRHFCGHAWHPWALRTT